jgi:hypothetical protein
MRTPTGCCANISTKNADLGSFTQDHLNYVAAKLTHRPRRVLDWTTPSRSVQYRPATPDAAQAGVAVQFGPAIMTT